MWTRLLKPMSIWPYGRDLQAEEILGALRSTPDRLAVRVKLLEVYAKRRDTKGFEQLAVQLFDLTGGPRCKTGSRHRNWVLALILKIRCISLVANLPVNP